MSSDYDGAIQRMGDWIETLAPADRTIILTGIRAMFAAFEAEARAAHPGAASSVTPEDDDVVSPLMLPGPLYPVEVTHAAVFAHTSMIIVMEDDGEGKSATASPYARPCNPSPCTRPSNPSPPSTQPSPSTTTLPFLQITPHHYIRARRSWEHTPPHMYPGYVAPRTPSFKEAPDALPTDGVWVTADEILKGHRLRRTRRSGDLRALVRRRVITVDEWLAQPAVHADVPPAGVVQVVDAAEADVAAEQEVVEAVAPAEDATSSAQEKVDEGEAVRGEGEGGQKKASWRSRFCKRLKRLACR